MGRFSGPQTGDIIKADDTKRHWRVFYYPLKTFTLGRRSSSFKETLAEWRGSTATPASRRRSSSFKETLAALLGGRFRAGRMSTQLEFQRDIGGDCILGTRLQPVAVDAARVSKRHWRPGSTRSRLRWSCRVPRAGGDEPQRKRAPPPLLRSSPRGRG